METQENKYVRNYIDKTSKHLFRIGDEFMKVVMIEDKENPENSKIFYLWFNLEGELKNVVTSRWHNAKLQANIKMTDGGMKHYADLLSHEIFDNENAEAVKHWKEIKERIENVKLTLSENLNKIEYAKYGTTAIDLNLFKSSEPVEVEKKEPLVRRILKR